ncbi:MltA domain-containing protein [Ancylobacter sp. WKF20]|uniref:murein transglycosylase A n=1 Tax=Ancylobacter sp. WKF20 TaxID=3039801 RepID=UPI0024343CDA|nr:MltA domain-containing protein [Ancylobacter sp. WKF20]WGD29278.1 MltA domain-containing protein [Ancylobacter sp. WKF20]
MRATLPAFTLLLALIAALLSFPGKARAASSVDAPPALFPQAVLEPVTFAAIPGWDADPVAPAFTAFRQSCGMIRKTTEGAAPARPVFLALRATCARALRLPPHPREHTARAFFRREFVPFRIAPLEQPQGFLTGYYEPEVEGSRTQTADYATPLYRRPPDLIVEAPPKDGAPANKGKAFRRDADGTLVPYHDRGAIEDGALAGKGLEVAWIKDPADAFFAHIQGSVRVKLPDGAVLRLNYDGHNGQPYTPVGRLLIERNLVPREKMSMDAIRAYIAAHPEEGRELMRQNRSYVFFREATELKPGDGAVGAQGLPLTAGRSIAVDRNIHVYGTPFFIAADLPTGPDGQIEPFRHLMVAQDTGSAIIGPARADIFFGAGKEAGRIAGRIQHPGQFVILLPRALDPTRMKVPRPKPRPAIPQTATVAP